MDLPTDWLSSAAVAAVVIVIAVGNYIRTRDKSAPANPTIAGIAVAFGDKEQTERLIAATVRMAVAMETLADKRTGEMVDIHKALLERLDAQERREEQEEAHPRPFRRRKPSGQ